MERTQTLEPFSRRFQLRILRDQFVKGNALGNEPVDFSIQCQRNSSKKRLVIIIFKFLKSILFWGAAKFYRDIEISESRDPEGGGS